MASQQAPNAFQGYGEFLGVGDVAGIDVMAQGEARFPVEHIAQPHLAQVVPALLVMPALRHRVAGVGGGNEGVKVGGVISQQAAADQLLFLPQTQQAGLRFFQRIALFALLLGLFLRQQLLEAIPESLGGEALRLEPPEGSENGLLIPVGHRGLGAGRAEAVHRRQQQVVSRGGTGAGLAPEGLQQSEDAGLLGGQPEGSGQTQFAAGGGEGKRRGALLEQGGDFFGAAQIGLVDDARAALNAGAVDDVVVKFVLLALGDKRSHGREIHTTTKRICQALLLISMVK